MRFKLFFWLLVTVLIIASAFFYIRYQQFVNTPLSIRPQGQLIEITPRSNFKKIIQVIDKSEITNQPIIFWKLLAKQKGVAHSLQAGEYDLVPGMHPGDILDKMAKGKVHQYRFTIVDGWSLHKLINKLAKADKLDHQLASKDKVSIAQALNMPADKLEGAFLPETYAYHKGESDISLLKRAHQAMQHVLEKEWPARQKNLPFDTPYQALILASIIEKETGYTGERPKVAGVFVRRLKRGMLLQTDPTVIYGLGEKYTGIITRQDLLEDTPYNTYIHKGLPPTPIALPGKRAIHAALHPAKGQALFFVAKGDGSGAHVFSKDLQGHNKAVKCYRTPGCVHEP